MTLTDTNPKTKSGATKATVFVDGGSGTTGLGIQERLHSIGDVAVKHIAEDKRKDVGAKRALMEEVDLVILCLPDDAAKETVALIDTMGNSAPKVLDASTAYRVAPDWAYGFAELAPGQADKIRTARKVSNPGCYPTGAIALLRPIVDAGLLPADYPVTINAVSGYSGGGKSMIASFEDGSAPAFHLYGLGFEHKNRNPLLARLNFLAIFGSNMDQSFMVRVSATRKQVEARIMEVFPDGLTPPEALAAMRKVSLELYGNALNFFNKKLVPKLDKVGINLLDYHKLSATQLEKVNTYFNEVVYPVLTPLALDPGHPFPHISNLSLNLAIVNQG